MNIVPTIPDGTCCHVESVLSTVDYCISSDTSCISSKCVTIHFCHPLVSGVREAYSKSNQYQLLDSAGYFLDNCQRIFAPKYVPTKNDVIRTRAKTTGIVEISFKFREMTFKMVDVGGQRFLMIILTIVSGRNKAEFAQNMCKMKKNLFW